MTNDNRFIKSYPSSEESIISSVKNNSLNVYKRTLKKIENQNAPDLTLLNTLIGVVVSVAATIVLTLSIFLFFFITKTPLFDKSDTTTYSIFLLVGIVFSSVLLGISFLFVFRNIKKITLILSINASKEKNNMDNMSEVFQQDSKLENIMQFLDEGEKEIFTILMDAGGSLLQKDIATLEGFSRSKITRILDKLEAKGLIERIRHGSTNEIILKRFSK